MEQDTKVSTTVARLQAEILRLHGEITTRDHRIAALENVIATRQKPPETALSAGHKAHITTLKKQLQEAAEVEAALRKQLAGLAA